MLVPALLQLTSEIPVEGLYVILRTLLNSLKSTQNALKTTSRIAPLEVIANQIASEEEESLKEGSITTTYLSRIVIHHGNHVVDRKSVFQAHLAHVHTMDEVEEVLQTLYTYNRIARASHNCFAYRIQMPKKNKEKEADFIIHQDHDSDGEGGAGSNMQWLLDTMGVVNVMVVVTRWYGGTKLGPDRFRHINNVTRAIVEQFCAVDRGKKVKPKK
eukprot:Gregarina_sp_Poly_1__9107@NODE_558_length_7531_cov_98_785102_g439_i0_p5_GENE_NODE_558_length_7531_cov_98_785102_g439_i0NODE_558_length_7531_cov_98_785102_g439_i0_p5_ORF_typecomplete_len215_score30_35UPF0029/PF01205_19/7_8e03UPF0029/PF01205_19/6_5e36_NODE_558_length_7531_cov_98_785102_g439_i040704714